MQDSDIYSRGYTRQHIANASRAQQTNVIRHSAAWGTTQARPLHGDPPELAIIGSTFF